jgi:energy-coupling factor transporter ATP-binding protein EcfA2
MQTIDTNTASPPLSIVRIEVEKLFGRYTYILSRENNYSDSSLIILYGDNGSGKTTILKLLFHLLSTSLERDHSTFLEKTRFAKFSVFLADGTSIIASRENSNLTGSIKVEILPDQFTHEIKANNAEILEENLEQRLKIEVLGINFYGMSSNSKLKEKPAYYNSLSKLRLNLFFLGDNRILAGDILDEEVKSSTRKYRDNFNVDNELKISIDRTEKWLEKQAFKGTNQGAINVNNIYEEIITKILHSSGNSLNDQPLQASTLIEELIRVENRNNDFSRFGLMPPLNTQKIVQILQASDTQANYPIVSRVLQPYLDSLAARFDALEVTQHLLTIFENTINNIFFRDKYIKLHVSEGLKIFTDQEQELSPDKLSSGEKQLLLLFCNTLTARDKATIFIIDEPEISLNVKWQRQLIRALLQLTKDSQVQFILATHSIELLSQYKNNVIKLEPGGNSIENGK